MLSRRRVLLAAGSAVLMHARVARAQPSKMLRVGFVGIQSRDAALYKSFLGRMAELGYREGRNFTFEYQQAPSIEGYDAAFRELATRKIDIFLAAGSEPSLRAVRAVAGTTPIAFLAIDFDPLAKGYVASLTRPGANITGILVQQIELAAKRIELVREAFPNANRVGLLFDKASREQADSSAAAARSLGFDSILIEVKGRRPITQRRCARWTARRASPSCCRQARCSFATAPRSPTSCSAVARRRCARSAKTPPPAH